MARAAARWAAATAGSPQPPWASAAVAWTAADRNGVARVASIWVRAAAHWPARSRAWACHSWASPPGRRARLRRAQLERPGRVAGDQLVQEGVADAGLGQRRHPRRVGLGRTRAERGGPGRVDRGQEAGQRVHRLGVAGALDHPLVPGDGLLERPGAGQRAGQLGVDVPPAVEARVGGAERGERRVVLAALGGELAALHLEPGPRPIVVGADQSLRLIDPADRLVEGAGLPGVQRQPERAARVRVGGMPGAKAGQRRRVLAAVEGDVGPQRRRLGPLARAGQHGRLEPIEVGAGGVEPVQVEVELGPHQERPAALAGQRERRGQRARDLLVVDQLVGGLGPGQLEPGDLLEVAPVAAVAGGVGARGQQAGVEGGQRAGGGAAVGRGRIGRRGQGRRATAIARTSAGDRDGDAEGGGGDGEGGQQGTHGASRGGECAATGGEKKGGPRRRPAGARRGRGHVRSRRWSRRVRRRHVRERGGEGDVVGRRVERQPGQRAG